ncbi:hypothetical protein [Sporosarcina sp. ITBMC105]
MSKINRLGSYIHKDTGEFVTVIGIGSFRSGKKKMICKKLGSESEFALREDKFVERYRRPTVEELMA